MIAPGTPPHGGREVIERGKPLGEGRVVVIMVHGRGAGPENILDLAPLIGHDDATYLAPSADGGTWYPNSFLAPIPSNEPGISSGISVIQGLIAAAAEAGVRPSRIVLLGFSQGACLVSTAVWRQPERYGGLIVFSGGLIGPPAAPAPGAQFPLFAGMPAFIGCSDVDAHIPAERVRVTAERFSSAGADVTMRLYPGMGHLVNEDELAVARTLIASLAAR